MKNGLEDKSIKGEWMVKGHGSSPCERYSVLDQCGQCDDVERIADIGRKWGSEEKEKPKIFSEVQFWLAVWMLMPIIAIRNNREWWICIYVKYKSLGQKRDQTRKIYIIVV